MRGLAEWDRHDEEPMPLNFVPDAYIVDHEAKEIILFEVGDWRLATHDKEARLGDFWFWWDAAAPDWTVRCFAVNRFGRFTHEMDLSGFYLDLLAEHSPRFIEAIMGRSQEKGGS